MADEIYMKAIREDATKAQLMINTGMLGAINSTLGAKTFITPYRSSEPDVDVLKISDIKISTDPSNGEIVIS